MCGETTAVDLLEQNFPGLSLEKKPVGFLLFVRRPLDTLEKAG
jgi:hypothetical protein